MRTAVGKERAGGAQQPSTREVLRKSLLLLGEASSDMRLLLHLCAASPSRLQPP